MKIHNSLKSLAVPIESLAQDPANARTHSRKSIESIKSSLGRFGQLKPIVLHRNGTTILAGNGTWEAAKELGWQEIAATKTDLESSESVAFAIADNRTAELADWDQELLDAQLAELKLEGQDLAELGFFDLDELEGKEKDGEKPEVVFSEFVNESNNYVVIVFDNDIDWLQAQTHFDLESKTSRRANGKPWSTGIGRVIKGSTYLNKMQGEFE